MHHGIYEIPPFSGDITFSPDIQRCKIFLSSITRHERLFLQCRYFPSISFCTIFFPEITHNPHPPQKAYDPPIPTHYLREMFGLILTENSFEFNGNNYLPAHGLQWAQKQTEIENFNPTKRPYQAMRMRGNAGYIDGVSSFRTQKKRRGSFYWKT